MSIIAILLIVALVAGLVGLLLQKVDELSGIGRAHRVGGFRWPHGELVRTSRLDEEEEPSRAALAKRVMLPSVAVAIVLCGAPLVIAPLSSHGDAATILSLACSLGIGSLACGKKPAGRCFAYVVIGLALACTLLVLLAQTMENAPVAEVNFLTGIFGAVGASAGAAAIPARITFAREFADGTQGVVRLSGRTTAARLLAVLEDPSWDVPSSLRERAERLDKPLRPRK